MKNKRFAVIAAGMALSLSLAACAGGGAGTTTDTSSPGDTSSSTEDTGEKKTVGVAMPTQTSERWIADGDAVKSTLEEAGYEVDLQYAGDDIPKQQEQIDQMIAKGVDALIIASIDGTALHTQLEAAGQASIPVIAYDRLINGTENVDFYVTFDNQNVGVQQATAVLTGLGIKNADGSDGDAKGPFNIELFAGSLDDNNAHFFWKGAIDTLQPYIDNGTLVVKSGQTDIEQVAILRWSQETAQKRMEDVLTAHYQDGSKVDAILAPNDPVARGAITALSSAGYANDAMPVMSGQDADIASVKLINEGVQYSTIFKDTRKLAVKSVEIATAYLKGEEPVANDTTTYDNTVKIVPSFLLESDIVYKEDIKPMLIDSGYWTQEQVDKGVA